MAKLVEYRDFKSKQRTAGTYELHFGTPYLQHALVTSFQPLLKKKPVTENVPLLSETLQWQ